MDRLIEVKVRGNFVSKDNKNAGTQGEYNITTMRIEFDEGWDGYAKHLTFWNAYGENPVKRILTADLLEDITASTRVYAVKIPGEPLAEAGEMSFVIDGYIDGVLQRTVEDKLMVKPANSAENAGEPADPTPSQAQQLQVQIDAVLEEVQKASAAATSAEEAAMSAEAARVSAGAAATSAAEAKTSEENAANSVTAAEAAKKAAEAAKTEAENAADRVESFAQAAAQSAAAASTSEKNAAASASEVANSIQSANASQQAAASSASAAASSANAAAQSATKAGTSEKNASASETAAKAAQAAAEKARDEAQQVAGGNFATPDYVDNKAAEAEANANQYTNQKIAAIPTPDVSKQISDHNTSDAAHNDVRLLIASLTERLNVLANSDDTTLDQMAEVVEYIKDNRELIEQITTGKVSVSDIVDNLTTNVTNKPLSAAQGVALKALVEAAAAAAAAAQNTANNAATAASKAASAASAAQATASGKASTATYTVTVDTSWTANSAGGFYKTVSVSGMLATDNPIADVVLGSDVDANILYLEAWALVTRISTAANSITLYAHGDAPATAFTIQLKAVR